jgi:hypothetical protein
LRLGFKHRRPVGKRVEIEVRCQDEQWIVETNLSLNPRRSPVSALFNKAQAKQRERLDTGEAL